jgi:hypothetical protein
MIAALSKHDQRHPTGLSEGGLAGATARRLRRVVCS